MEEFHMKTLRIMTSLLALVICFGKAVAMNPGEDVVAGMAGISKVAQPGLDAASDVADAVTKSGLATRFLSTSGDVVSYFGEKAKGFVPSMASVKAVPGRTWKAITA